MASDWFEVWGVLGWIKNYQRFQPKPTRRGQGGRRPPDLEHGANPSQGTGAQAGAKAPTGGDGSYQGGFDRFNDPSAGSPTETLLRLLLPLGGRV
jgi:hypothetical protein